MCHPSCATLAVPPLLCHPSAVARRGPRFGAASIQRVERTEGWCEHASPVRTLSGCGEARIRNEHSLVWQLPGCCEASLVKCLIRRRWAPGVRRLRGGCGVESGVRGQR
jgi:hypothetical protein